MTVDLQNMTVPEDVMAELGAKIAQHPTLSHHSSPAVLSRMLLARHLHVDDAYVLWEGWAAWREDEKPELIDEASVAPQLAVQTVSVTGMDKSGRTCVILRTRNHVPGQFPFEDMLRLTIWVLETSTSRSVKTSGTGYITAIWDCKGQGFRNLDTALATHKPGIIHIMKEYYPECLQTLLIVNSNWVFRVFWTVIYPFIDERTKHKVHVLKDEAALLEYFHPQDLPSDFAHLAK
ncbi:cral trio domain containing protein [Nannochloropsis gaditana]|uniref:Cral trio domain containing protein n=1 Tax=Nannochloropsis gaditana TaxID=72520 RepID=W7TVQ7_9STRA|nr:cral trio domain containing protein [Nannochloropsis gaditana]